MELTLHCWPDGGCGDTTKANTRYQVGLRQTSTLGYARMGRVNWRGFARRACCCCLRLQLLVAAGAPGDDVARGCTHALQMMYRSVSLGSGNLVSNGLEFWSTPLSGKLDQSKASGELSANGVQRSHLISPIYGSTIICVPNMT